MCERQGNPLASVTLALGLSLVLICRQPGYLGRGRRHYLGQCCGICEHLSPIHTCNLSQALIPGLPAKSNSAQLRRQVGGQCLGQIICRR